MATEENQEENSGATLAPLPESGEAAGEEETDQEGGSSNDSTSGNLTSPEGILMLLLAVGIDGTGLIITFFLLDDLGILDAIGMVVIGGWMYSRSGSNAGSATKKGLKRFILSFAVELTPYLGGVSPSWTWLVYKTLKDG